MAWQDFVLKHYLIIGLFTVICFGLVVPQIGLAIKEVDIGGSGVTVANLAVLLVFFISGLSLNSVTDFLQIKGLVLAVGLILLVTPLLAWAIIFCCKGLVAMPLLQGMAVFCLVPTTLSSGVTIVAQAQGNVALAVLITTCSNLLGVLTMPLSASQIFGASLSVSPLDLLIKLLWLALAPLSIGILLRKFVTAVNERVKQHKKKLGITQNSCILLVVWLMVSGAQHKIVTSAPQDLVACSIMAAWVHLIFRVFNGSVAKFAGLGDSEWITVTLMASQKSLPGCVSILSALPSHFRNEVGLMIVPCIMAHAGQLVIDSFLASCWARRMQSKAEGAAVLSNTKESSLQMVFMNVGEVDHVEPTLPVVKELTRRGHVVTYFVEESMRESVETAGATWKPYRYQDSNFTGLVKCLDEEGVQKYVPTGTPPERYSDTFQASAFAAEKVLPALLEDLDSLALPPAVIVFDGAVTAAKVAAQVRRVPGVVISPTKGPRNSRQKQERPPWVEGPRKALMERYGVDFLDSDFLSEQHSLDCDIVTTIQDIFLSASPAMQVERYGKAPFHSVGPVDEEELDPSFAGFTGDSSQGMEAKALKSNRDRAAKAAKSNQVKGGEGHPLSMCGAFLLFFSSSSSGLGSKKPSTWSWCRE